SKASLTSCALFISNAPQRNAFPHRLTGPCPLNATLSAKSTSFFAITVPDCANLRSDRPSGSTGHPGSAAGAVRLAPKSRVQANCYAGADYIVPFSAILSAQQGISHPSSAIPILNGSEAEEGWVWQEMIGVVSSLDARNGFDIPNTIAIRLWTIRQADGTRAHCRDRVRISRTSSKSRK